MPLRTVADLEADAGFPKQVGAEFFVREAGVEIHRITEKCRRFDLCASCWIARE